MVIAFPCPATACSKCDSEPQNVFSWFRQNPQIPDAHLHWRITATAAHTHRVVIDGEEIARNAERLYHCHKKQNPHNLQLACGIFDFCDWCENSESQGDTHLSVFNKKSSQAEN